MSVVIITVTGGPGEARDTATDGPPPVRYNVWGIGGFYELCDRSIAVGLGDVGAVKVGKERAR